ncbi:EAL domain-containing protein [Paraliobacillus sediminis]|uniref:EAL domain-containing protein n=1 Tax=Paraliobacillus sediminis TaxID=1885916 RepID=UPI000E3E75F7|nr:EAL domain-containing protein [Paraliobacillus sediminis]
MLIDPFIEEEQFHHFFQPIFDVKSLKMIGFEILLRSNVFENPEQAFQAAKEANRLYDLDIRSIHNALSTYQDSPFPIEGQLLFINVFPSTLSNPNFNSFLDQLTTKLALSSKRIVLEVSESELIEHPDNFLQHLELLRQQGFTIALDDVGKGYANFDMLIKMEPDYIKLDRLFADQLDISKKKQDLVRFFLNYCHEHQVDLILEGIETKAELQMAEQLGIPYAQGFYLGRPAPFSEWITVHT